MNGEKKKNPWEIETGGKKYINKIGTVVDSKDTAV